MRLTETLKKINTSLHEMGDIPKDIFTFLAILLLGGAAFMLGSISAGEISRKEALRITAPQNMEAGVFLAENEQNSASSAPQRDAKASDQGAQKPSARSELKSGSYIGSKNGKVYYLPSCAGVKRIKEENKIWFSDKADAETQGYRRAGNCKQMQ